MRETGVVDAAAAREHRGDAAAARLPPYADIPMWNDVNGNGYTQLWPKLQSGTFDLIGFQESDIQRILSNAARGVTGLRASATMATLHRYRA